MTGTQVNRALAELSDHLSGRPSFNVNYDAILLSQEIALADFDQRRNGGEPVDISEQIRTAVRAAPERNQGSRSEVSAEAREGTREHRAREREFVRSRIAARGAEDDLPHPSITLRSVVEAELKEKRLSEMNRWQQTAQRQLTALAEGRATLNGEARAFPLNARDRTEKTARRLIEEMSQNGVYMSVINSQQGNWEAAETTARDVVVLRSRRAAEILGASLPPLPRAHLQVAYASFVRRGNTPHLRSELEEARKASPEHAGLARWSARYSIMAGDYAAAAEAVADFGDDAQIRRDILPLISAGFATSDPAVTHPASFYRYQETLASDAQLAHLADELEQIVAMPNIPTGSSDVEKWLQDQAAAAAAGAVAAQTQQMEEELRDVFEVDEFDYYLGDDPVSLKAAARARRVRRLHDARTAAAGQAAIKKAREAVTQQAFEALKEQAAIALRAVGAMQSWNQAVRAMAAGKYPAAERTYGAFRVAVENYLVKRYPVHKWQPVSEPTAAESQLVAMAQTLRTTPAFQAAWPARRSSTSVSALANLDWTKPHQAPPGRRPWERGLEFIDALNLQGGAKAQEKVDVPLLTMALVHASMGMAEAARHRKDTSGSTSVCDTLLGRHTTFAFLSDVVEVPFVKLLRARAMLDTGEQRYKARDTAGATAAYQTVVNSFSASPGGTSYKERIEAASASLSTTIDQLAAKTFDPRVGGANVLSPQERQQVAKLGKAVLVSGATPAQGGEFPDARASTAPHEPLVVLPGAPIETDPLIYSVVAQARARLLQLGANLNYLGYPDNYVPVWRFPYLLERARYFAQHAISAERDYLNFLERGENEEFKELGATQAVALEKSSLRTEDARLDLARGELTAAKKGQELANLTSTNAETRIARFQSFDGVAAYEAGRMVEAAWWGAAGAILSGVAETIGDIAEGRALAPAGIAKSLGGIASGISQVMSQESRNAVEAAQRQYELANLRLAKSEAAASAQVAATQVGVAKTRLKVSAMERSTTALRHDHALDNLNYLRHWRTLNSELWLRLAEIQRELADSYLRKAIELAFLTEQAYEFEAQKEMNVIRFDYDASETDSMLAGDFLRHDLDLLESDMIVNQRVRQQRVRYVVSLARDFPAALQDLRRAGSTIFTLTLRQLEERFAGLYGIRIGSVSLLPVALMDPTRFSAQLTNAGANQVRRAGPIPGAATATIPGWIPGIATEWPVAVQVSSPETNIYSGMSKSEEETGPFRFIAANERGAFEGLGAASSWHLDMSMERNQVDPGTLADVLVTFDLYGYHDPVLRTIVESAPALPSVSTQFLSARERFPDAFYSFNRRQPGLGGKLELPVSRRMLSLDSKPGSALRNVGVLLTPSPGKPEHNALWSSYDVEFTISSTGALTVASAIPELTFGPSSGLNVAAQVTGGGSAEWDFGDGDQASGASVNHEYKRPGAYTITVRIAQGNRLYERRANVVVSRTRTVHPPVTARPALSTVLGAPPGFTRVKVETRGPASNLSAIWRVEGQPEPGADTIDLRSGVSAQAPARYVLRWVSVRDLTARIYSDRRYIPGSAFAISGMRAATNRTFDDAGNETTAQRNPLASQLFDPGPLAPADRWTLELPLAENEFLRMVKADDTDGIDLGLIGDVTLMLEYSAG